MKILILITAFLAVFLGKAEAQEYKIYKGRNKSDNNSLLYIVKDKNVYDNKNNVRFTIKALDKDTLMVSNESSKYKLTNNKIIEISNKNEAESKTILNIKNGEVYLQESSSRLQILYTLKDGKIYKGRSTSSLDVIYSYQESQNTDKVLIALLTHIEDMI